MLVNIIQWCLLLTTVTLRVAADVSISSPGTGKTYSASSGSVTVPIKWIDSGTDPSLDDITSMTFSLCTGPNSDIDCFTTLAKETSSDISSKKYSATIDADACADGLFYIQIYSVTDDGYTIHYTNRFTLSDMTGSQKASGSGSAPDSQTSISGGTTLAAVVSKSFSVTYTLQTGKTRYAPMQLQPGSTVTATSWSRRFPTSAVTYYTTIHKSPNVYSTITPGWSYTMESLINYATPAPHPSVVGWYAASERVQSATLSGAKATSSSSSKNKKRQRWDID